MAGDIDPESGGISLPRASSSDLRGMQSVRATFKLSEGCIEAISIVATQLGIKQKSLFDHLVEDIQTLSSVARKLGDGFEPGSGGNRVQKTYVISRRSLTSLEKVSKNYNAPRDALVEFSVQRLLPVIAKERQRHESRKKALQEIRRHMQTGQALLEKMADRLGHDDPIYSRFESAMAVYENAYRFIDAYVEKGRTIENFEPATLQNMGGPAGRGK